MNPQTKRQLGTTRVAVTRLGLGGAPFGNVFNDLSDQAASNIIAAAYAAGVRYFDTAPLYGRGRALDNIFVERLWRSLKFVP